MSLRGIIWQPFTRIDDVRPISLSRAASAGTPERRAVSLACDDYSAVSGKVSLTTPDERGRSLGIGVQVSDLFGR